MKNTLKLSFTALAFTVILFTSCKKDNQAAVSTTAYLMVTNAAEGSSAQDVLLDNTKLSGSTVAYTQSSGYITVNSGDHQGQFVTSGSANVNSSFSLSLQPGQYYTIYYTGGASSSSYVAAQSDQTAPAANQAKVRFINLSSAVTGAVDFGLSATSKLATGLAAKTASAYYAVAASSSFYLYAAGSNTVSLAIQTTLQAGKIYTIYVSGATTASLTYKVVAEN